MRLIWSTGAEGVWQHKSDVHPIPLTEKWLKHFGFKAKRKANKKKNDLNWYDEDESIRLDRNFGDTMFFLAMGYDTITENQPETIWCIINDCKYVHELQNLYYTLTRQELIYKK